MTAAETADEKFAVALEDTRRRVEIRLVTLLADRAVPARLSAAMRHGVLGGGKRFRPFLVLETARLFGAPANAALDVAAALECIHCYSLVHDDLPAMDNDELRRSQPTVWKAYDEWTAILAGDALLTEAFTILAGIDNIAPPVRLRLVAELARASGAAGMVGGQALDLDADKRSVPARPDLGHIRHMQSLKTGALIRFAATAGPILANAEAAHVARLATYGDNLGFAFQISDDLLDATGTAVEVGKAVAKDAAAGKATLVGLMGVDAARKKLTEVEAAAIGVLEPYGAGATVLRAAVRFMAVRRS